jgi:hypothetical protein
VGPGGLAALVVATLGLPSTYYVEIRASLWQAMARMYLDPRWAEIKTPEDAKALVREYL